MALLARGKSGRGQVVDSALYECAFSFMEPHIPAYDKLGLVASRTGSRLPDSTPNNLYATGDGQFIHITAMADGVFRRLTACMEQPALADDPRFRAAVDRSANHEAIDDLVGAWTKRHDLETLERVLGEADVPATRIFTLADIFRDPHYAARGTVARAPDPDFGDVAMAAPAPRLSETPGAIRHAGHRVGEDTRDVFTRVAGMTDAEIDQLIAAGVLYDGARAAGPTDAG
jgi:crotonobetainyl-CoA:carnitine CoA-transferase CaiB-like acyl-CoA transferase